MPLLAAEPETVLGQPEKRTVVEHMAFVVAPGGVVDAAGLELRYVAQA